MRSAPDPGLPPAVAEHRDPPRSALGTAALAAAVVLGAGAVRGLLDGDGPVPGPGTLVIALVAAAVLGLNALRSGTAAGPGWLVQRRIAGSSWVRTDQLAEVRAGRGVGDVHLRLRDRDGRRLSVAWSALAASPPLLDRVRQDVQVSAGAGADLDTRSAQLLLDGRR